MALLWSLLCYWQKFDKVLQISQMLLSLCTALQSKWLSRSLHFVSTRNFDTHTKTLIFWFSLRILYRKYYTGRSSWWVQSNTHQSGSGWQSWLNEAPTPESDCWGVFRTWKTSKTSWVSWIKLQVPTVCKHHQTNQIEWRFWDHSHHQYHQNFTLCSFFYRFWFKWNLWD